MTRSDDFDAVARGKRRGSLAVSGASGDSWYVTFHNPDETPKGYYIRNTQTFRTEAEAKEFARVRLFEGCNVTAGTLNPHFPKRIIGFSQLENWLKSD